MNGLVLRSEYAYTFFLNPQNTVVANLCRRTVSPDEALVGLPPVQLTFYKLSVDPPDRARQTRGNSAAT